jgi:glycosyltransferase involved in cell wall biosynthesis
VKIGLVATHSWPVPYKSHTGDHWYAGLAQVLDEMGHEVYFFASEGSYIPSHGKLLPITCSWGTGTPSPSECEQQCFDKYADILRNLDVIHDMSITKRVAENLFKEGKTNVISTPLGGTWQHPNPAFNFVVSSQNMKDRALRGATDYENTPTPDAAGPPQAPIKDAHVVYYGIDTNFYTPTYDKKKFFLWLGRWHHVRGYHLAIQLAKETGIELVMAGEHPDREVSDYQKQCSFEAVELARDCPNIHFEWLPADPHHHEAKRVLLQSAKALIFPVQFQEPFGLMQPEALACGTPIIGTNFGSVPEIVKDGVTGFVVDNNWQAFSNAISKIDQIQPAVCRAQAVKRFDRKVMAENYIKEYLKVINGETW